MNKVYLGLGSNIGDKIRFLKAAIDQLAALDGVTIDKISSYYETDPVGYEEQDVFVNCVVSINCDCEPYYLLRQLQKIETNLKRRRIIRWGPRTIDIDILFMDNHEVYDKLLTVPHPLMLERAFVLVPLCEIAPQLVIHEKAVVDWLEDVDTSGVRKLDGN